MAKAAKLKDRENVEAHLLLLTRQFLLEQGSNRALQAVTADASLERDLGIDSLGKAELFRRIENMLDVTFSNDVISQTDTLRVIAKASLTAPSSKKFQHDFQLPVMQNLAVDLSHIKTLQEALIEYALHDPNRPHIYLRDEHGKEEVLTYGELLSQASTIAANLTAAGIKEDDPVALMLPTCCDFFTSFFGILFAGAIPVPVYPPFRPDRIEEYAIREAKIFNNAEIRALITFSQAEMLGKILKTYVPSLKLVTKVSNLSINKQRKMSECQRTEESAALIQYTSGSTGDPKGVFLLQKNIMANIYAIKKALNPKPSDAVVSWLPLYHDMGLMSWLGSLYFGIPFTIMSPMTFLNHPEEWLWAIHYHRATISASPNFGYELCAKKIDTDKLTGLDLSCWRIAFNGAEFVSAATLSRFYEKFKSYGLKKSTMKPVYGLAENTVGLTIPDLTDEPHIDIIIKKDFESAMIAKVADKHEESVLFVSAGKALPDHEIRIVNDDNIILGERHVGNIQFRGPSAMQGYYRNKEATDAIYHAGWWSTGDLGYKVDNELYVTGRKKDMIIKAGRNLYPEAIEESVGQVPGIRKGCIIAFGIADAETGTEKIIVAAETALLKEIEHFQQAIIEHVAAGVGLPPDEVIILPPHAIPKTSSGKLQRSACKQAYLAGKLTKKKKTFVWQAVALAWDVLKKRMLHLAKKGIYFLYTTYVFMLVIIMFFPLRLIVCFLPPKKIAALIRSSLRVLLKLSLCPIKTINDNKKSIKKPVIYAANHASYTDAVLLLAELPSDILIVVKKEMLKWPLVGSIIKKLGYLIVDRWDFNKNMEDVEKIKNALAKHQSILIFPEGTFTYASGLRPFKTGAFQLSVDSGVPICPIAIKGSRQLLRDGKILLSPTKLTLRIGECIQPQGDDWLAVIQLRNKVRTWIAKYCGEPCIDLISAEPQKNYRAKRKTHKL
ncbi:MAG: AMP-binding protein [Legionellales bacterium]|nr:AMP-binding protein [Legionellales bacterium]